MIQQRLVADMDLILLKDHRHRDDDRELLGITLEVVRHRQHSLIVLAYEDDLRSLVEQLRVSLRDVETAEREESRATPGGPHDQDRHQNQPFHASPSFERKAPAPTHNASPAGASQ